MTSTAAPTPAARPFRQQFPDGRLAIYRDLFGRLQNVGIDINRGAHALIITYHASHVKLPAMVLAPLLKKLNIPRAGLHAFRHSRVTMLRKYGTPGDLQKQWIGHSSLRTTDRYSHTDQELEYRRAAAGKILQSLMDPGGHLGPRFEDQGREHPQTLSRGI